ncbi:MAG: hypothetical protein Q8P68_01700 [Candidatus Peregrinibacteria bacterium]|nr:hypothetical protein [Candidatus Peregrinibacteria bacterium]MDZ4244588.1 hypothetical protein [Candidatus Gracilibacteria bacterium]
MTDRWFEQSGPPKSVALNLPAKRADNVLSDAGFAWDQRMLLENAGLDPDYETFQRESSPAGMNQLFEAPLSEVVAETIAEMQKYLAMAVSDTAITDENIEELGPSEVSALQAANLENPLIQRITQRMLALVHRSRLEKSPIASVTATMLLMGKDSPRAIGSDVAIFIPNGIKAAFKQLDDARSKLPGGTVFSRMLYGRDSHADRESLFAEAKVRSSAFFDSITAVIDVINDDDLLYFKRLCEDPIRKPADRLKQAIATHNVLEPLEACDAAFREAIIEYARNIEDGTSHFGSVIQESDVNFKAIGVDKLGEVTDSASEFVDNDYLKKFVEGARNVHHLPGLSEDVAHAINTNNKLSEAVFMIKAMETQTNFQASITHEILMLLNKIERHYGSQMLKQAEGRDERNAMSAKLGIARGMIIELLMINMFFINTLEKDNRLLQKFAEEFHKNPDQVVGDEKSLASLKWMAHFSLTNSARLAHSRKIALTMLQGALKKEEEEEF